MRCPAPKAGFGHSRIAASCTMCRCASIIQWTTFVSKPIHRRAAHCNESKKQACPVAICQQANLQLGRSAATFRYNVCQSSDRFNVGYRLFCDVRQKFHVACCLIFSNSSRSVGPRGTIPVIYCMGNPSFV